ncbi:MAG: DUF5069 domain-containing protein [Luteolibacter sp.]
MKLPSPYFTLAGCVWLPRILAKARLFAAGELPEDYAARFGHPTGVDGQFLNWFGLGRDEIVSAAAGTDLEVEEWFQVRFDNERIANWNHVALNLGRPGFPMEERLPVAKATSYSHLDTTGVETVFEVLALDEAD